MAHKDKPKTRWYLLYTQTHTHTHTHISIKELRSRSYQNQKEKKKSEQFNTKVDKGYTEFTKKESWPINPWKDI